MSAPTLYFGQLQPSRHCSERESTPAARVGPHVPSYLRGPIVFRRRLRVGDAVLVESIEKTHRRGTIANVDADCESPYLVRMQDLDELKLYPHELRPVEDETAVGLEDKATSSSSSRPSCSAMTTSTIYEAVISWHPELAGRMLDLPAESATAARRMGLQLPLRFELPDVDCTEGAVVVVHAQLLVPAGTPEPPTSFTVPRLLAAPWVASRRHWRLGDHWGVPEGRMDATTSQVRRKALAARAARSSRASPGGGGGGGARPPLLPMGGPLGRGATDAAPVAEQTADGAVRLLQQCSGGCTGATHGRFVTLVSTHLVDADEHVFCFEILQCAADRAAGLRVGVCSEDGKQQ